jgi:Colicin V production protein.
MNFIIDLLLLFIIIFSVISGIRKGFIHSVMNIITFTAALICGWQFYPILSLYYKERIFLSRISNEIYHQISLLVNTSFDSLLSDLPEALIELTDRFGIDISALETYYLSQTADNLTEKISTFIAEPVAASISNILAFTTIFLGVTIILKIVTLILDMIFKLPVLNTLNRVCGFILGVFNGLLYAALFSMVLAMLSPVLTALIPEFYTSGMIDTSVFVTVINKLNIAPK